MTRKLRIAVLSNCRTPTRANNCGGLGKSAIEIAAGLAERGHDVTLFAGAGSSFLHGVLICHETEMKRAIAFSESAPPVDVFLDTSHWHDLSRFRPDLPIVNRIADRECSWQPPRAVVNSKYMQVHYPDAKLVKTGVDGAKVEARYHLGLSHLVYASGDQPHKGYLKLDQLRSLSARSINVIINADSERLNKALCDALGLVHPSTIDAAPRLPLEAALAGTPTLCLDSDGAQEHVKHCVSGFVCSSIEEMAEAANDLALLNRRHVREWVEDEHGYVQMIDAYEQLLYASVDGLFW